MATGRNALLAERLFLYSTVLIAFALPRYLDDAFQLKLWEIGYLVPPLAIFWLPMLIAIAVANRWARTEPAATPNPADVLFMAAIALMIILEFYHSAARGTRPDFEFIYVYALIGLLLFTLKSFAPSLTSSTALTNAIVYIAAGASLIALIGISEHGPVLGGRRPELDIVNRSSHAAVFGATLALWSLLNVRHTKSQSFLYWVCIAINVLLIVANRSRGPWLVLVGLSTVMILWRLIQVRPRIGLIVAAAALIVAGLAIGLLPSRMEAILSLGRGLLPGTEAEIRMHADLERTGAAVRLAMAQAALGTFVAHPFTGIGLGETMATTIQDHRMHGVALIGLASYGLAGILPLVALFSFKFPPRAQFDRVIAVLVAGAVPVLLAQDQPLWLALLPFCLGPREQES